MNIHEYQAKELLSQYGVAAPTGKVAFREDEAHQIAKDLNVERFVVKAQIHAGGSAGHYGLRRFGQRAVIEQSAHAADGDRRSVLC